MLKNWKVFQELLIGFRPKLSIKVLRDLLNKINKSKKNFNLAEDNLLSEEWPDYKVYMKKKWKYGKINLGIRDWLSWKINSDHIF